MPEYKTPQPIVDLLRPLANSQSDRRVWSIPLNTVWVPFFTATNVQGATAVSHEALGAPLRLGKAKDGTVRFGSNGKPVVRVNKELSDQVRTVRDNFTASLVDFTAHTQKARAADYKAQVEAALKAGQPVIEAERAAVEAALKAQAEAEAKTEAMVNEALAGADITLPVAA